MRGLVDRRWPGALRSLPRTPCIDPRGAVGPGRPRRRGHRLTRTTTRTLLCCSGLGGLAVARASGATAGRLSSLHDAPILARQSWCSLVPSGIPSQPEDPYWRPETPGRKGVESRRPSIYEGHRSSGHRPGSVGTCREATGMPTPGGRGSTPGVVATNESHASVRRSAHGPPGGGASANRTRRLGDGEVRFH
jgi:hypothetical protein